MPTKKPAKKLAPRTKRVNLTVNGPKLAVTEQVKAMNDIFATDGVFVLRSLSEKKIAELTASLRTASSAAISWENRALAAEKHNAILLAERDELKNYNVNSECERKHWHDLYVNGKRNCDAFHSNLLSSPTRWQRLTSWAARWSIEIACALAILAVFALASWYALRWGK